MSNFPQIVVGTYEEFVLGYKPKIDNAAENKYQFFQTFAAHSHQASLRCIAANKNLMATSGADEYINIYNMNAMKIFTVIDYHNSTVTCLEFTPDNSHLVTANQKGDIAIFRCKDWNLVKLWKEAHKHANGVTSMSIHPTGSLLLTTGADNKLIFWNLIKGRQAYVKNFSKASIECRCSLNFGLWSQTGKYYVICVGKQLEVYKTSTAAVIYKITANSKITCATFSRKILICIGTEEGTLEVHSLIGKKLVIQMQAHKFRLKCISSFCKTVKKKNTTKINNYLVTADSKGIIKLWHLKKKENNFQLVEKCVVDCDCRITCLTRVFPTCVKKEKLDKELLTEGSEKSADGNETAKNGIFSSSSPKKQKINKNKLDDSILSINQNSSFTEAPVNGKTKKDRKNKNNNSLEEFNQSSTYKSSESKKHKARNIIKSKEVIKSKKIKLLEPEKPKCNE